MKNRKISRGTVQRGMKLCFSAVLMQLLYISLCLGGQTRTPVRAVPEMLECAAASAALIFAGAYLLEYYLSELFSD